MGKMNICLDIGGTKILGAVVDEDGKIVHRIKKKTKAEKGSDQIEVTIIKLVEELMDEAKLSKSDLAAIGAGIPGVIDQKNGVIIYSPNLPWRNYDIRSKIEDKFKVPFYAGNDVNVGILGEWKYGAGIKKENIIGLFVGTGVGGGLIVDGKLFTGARHAGAELGHIILNTEGPYCNCGQRGCLEAYAGKIGIMRELTSQISRGRKTVLQESLDESGAILKSKALKKAVEAKDELALEVIDRATYYLAAGAGSLVNIFNPDMIILGGGVIESLGDYVIPRFKEEIKRFVMPVVFDGTEILESKLGDDAIIYGALALIKEKGNV